MSAASATSPGMNTGCSRSEIDPASLTTVLPTAPAIWPATLLLALRGLAGSMWNYLRQNQVLPALRRMGNYLQQNQALPALRKRPRRLRMSETLSLGDKRSVYLLEVDGRSLLIGSSGTSIALLAHLSPSKATEQEQAGFEGVLRQSLDREEVR